MYVSPDFLDIKYLKQWVSRNVPEDGIYMIVLGDKKFESKELSVYEVYGPCGMPFVTSIVICDEKGLEVITHGFPLPYESHDFFKHLGTDVSISGDENVHQSKKYTINFVGKGILMNVKKSESQEHLPTISAWKINDKRKMSST